jgi:hypothetical protein
VGEDWVRWLRQQRGAPALGFSCDLLLLRVDFVDGEVRSQARADIPVTEYREVRAGCAQNDPQTGACIRWNYRQKAVTVRRSGSVRLVAA